MDNYEPPRSPSEHMERLRQEQAEYGRMFPEPVRYYVRYADGTEEEVTWEEYVATFRPRGGEDVSQVG